ncbi:MAG: sensor domain-containing phosphodiesterase [Stagnimonas sp.]|nr:sensor domain-containing phosphodiesterase [Stagnimonas sp.]
MPEILRLTQMRASAPALLLDGSGDLPGTSPPPNTPDRRSGPASLDALLASLSVRARLWTLTVGLFAVLGTANMLLGQIIQQRVAQEQEQSEQYSRLQTIQLVREAMSEVRHYESSLNVARLVGDEALKVQSQARLQEAEAGLATQLSALAVFDGPGVDFLKRQRELAQAPMRQAINAISGKQEDSLRLTKQTMQHLTAIQDRLHQAAERERLRAEALTASQIAGAQAGFRASMLIVFGALLLGLLFCALVLRSIMRPLRATTAALKQINEGQSLVEMPPISADEFGEMALALRQFRDQADRLRELAYADPLTGLGNRARMDHALRAAVARCRDRGTRLALLSIDLDGFGAINDGLGYNAGDAYLREAGLRLSRFAPEEAVLCRHSGDKFTVLIEAADPNDTALLPGPLRDTAELILRGMAESFQYREHLLPMSVSIGIAQFPRPCESESELISGADAAMYLAKRDGRHCLRFADRQLSTGARQELADVADIRRGIEQEEFQAFFQPIVNVVAGRVAGAEALLRWRHPQRGLLGADRFIPAAEANGQIHALSEICLRRVGEQLCEWASAGSGLWLSTNLSVRQLEGGALLTQLAALRERNGFVPANLLLEITESAALERVDHAKETLAKIREMGFHLGMDDFGTGYSSMVYLQRFPVDKIKIDRLFVSRMDSSREAVAIVSATIAIARSLQLQVVAEGVETEEQSQRLRYMGCPLQQGFLFSPALPPEEFGGWRQRFEAADRSRDLEADQV